MNAAHCSPRGPTTQLLEVRLRQHPREARSELGPEEVGAVRHLGSDVFATSKSPGRHFDWTSEGYDPGTTAIDVYGIVGATCPADLDESGDVGFDDILAILRAWGICPDHCPEDLDHDDVVDIQDLIIVLNAWGPCQ